MVEAGERLPQHELQADFNLLVRKFHRHAMDAFGQNGRFAGGVGPKDTPAGKLALLQLANTAIIDFSKIYGSIPEGHHLKIGLTPLAYSAFSGDSNTQPLCAIENTDTGPTYWLRVARRVGDPKTLAPGRTVLNITPVGNTSDEGPRGRFDFVMLNPNERRDISPTLYPEDILSLQVAVDAPRRP